MRKWLGMICGEIHLPTLLLCSGCLLPICGKFPQMLEMIQEKWALAGMLVIFLSSAISILRRTPFPVSQDKVLKTFVLLGAIEILIVVLQSLRIIASLHPFFRFTGTFGNPTLFAMMMALCLPICTFYLVKSADKRHTPWLFLTICVWFFLILSESRTCVIAGICSSFVITFMEISKIRSLLTTWKSRLLVLLGCIILLATLYCYKRDSADGRALIWAVSLKMISEKPFLGWGEYGFSSSYMPAQAIFLKDFPEGGLSYLADNISHPFNEFLLFCINYGVIGFAMLLCLMVLLANRIVRIGNTRKSLYLAILLTLVVLSMFSYPFTVPVIWLASTFLICVVLPLCCLNTPRLRIPVVILLCFGILWILVQNRHICAVWQWQDLQTSSSPIEVVHKKYNRLYRHLDKNPSFLYNYGAWLHHNGYYWESLGILSECVKTYDDYNVELLIADNHKQLGNTKKAIETFEHANAMVPCRFLPLYHEMTIYEANGDYVNAVRIAKRIVTKPVKIGHSASVKKIIHEAECVIHRWEAIINASDMLQENDGQNPSNSR